MIKRRKIRHRQKTLLLIMSLTLILLTAFGVTLAYLMTKTDSLTNTFQPSSTGIEIIEDFNSKIKENVHIKNTGDTDVYVRIQLVGNWYRTITENDQNVEQLAGKSTWEVPDEFLNISTNDKWFRGTDGYFYYKEAIAPESITENIIDSIELKKDSDGTYQGLEIIAECIQSRGTTFDGTPAVEDAWKVVTVDTDKTLKAK